MAKARRQLVGQRRVRGRHGKANARDREQNCRPLGSGIGKQLQLGPNLLENGGQIQTHSSDIDQHHSANQNEQERVFDHILAAFVREEIFQSCHHCKNLTGHRRPLCCFCEVAAGSLTGVNYGQRGKTARFLGQGSSLREWGREGNQGKKMGQLRYALMVKMLGSSRTLTDRGQQGKW